MNNYFEFTVNDGFLSQLFLYCLIFVFRLARNILEVSGNAGEEDPVARALLNNCIQGSQMNSWRFVKNKCSRIFS